MSVHRFPKWLTSERFAIFHLPGGKWHVQIYRDSLGTEFNGEGDFNGYAPTIALAARRALAARNSVLGSASL